MSINIKDEELGAVLMLSGEKRYRYSIKKIVDWESVWSLRDTHGWILANDPEGFEVVPVWPHFKYAQICAIDNWQDAKATAISLEIWLERWIPGLISDQRKIAVCPTLTDKGVVVDAKRFRNDILNEMEGYE